MLIFCKFSYISLKKKLISYNDMPKNTWLKKAINYIGNIYTILDIKDDISNSYLF